MLTARLLEACDFAAKQHVNQRRKNKNKDPYINHPIEVAKLCAMATIEEPDFSPDVTVVALLHDTIEDCATTYDEIKNVFGERLANMVLECSDDKKLDKVTRKKLQIEHAKTVSPQAKIVKLADKYSNCKDLFDNPPKNWKIEIIYGYLCWSFAVVKQLRLGIPQKAQQYFDDLFVPLWEKTNLLGMDEDALQSNLDLYYNLLHFS